MKEWTSPKNKFHPPGRASASRCGRDRSASGTILDQATELAAEYQQRLSRTTVMFAELEDDLEKSAQGSGCDAVDNRGTPRRAASLCE